MKQRKGRKPKCYESYRYNVCLGHMTRKGTVGFRCQKCKWLEENAYLWEGGQVEEKMGVDGNEA